MAESWGAVDELLAWLAADAARSGPTQRTVCEPAAAASAAAAPPFPALVGDEPVPLALAGDAPVPDTTGKPSCSSGRAAGWRPRRKVPRFGSGLAPAVPAAESTLSLPVRVTYVRHAGEAEAIACELHTASGPKVVGLDIEWKVRPMSVRRRYRSWRRRPFARSATRPAALGGSSECCAPRRIVHSQSPHPIHTLAPQSHHCSLSRHSAGGIRFECCVVPFCRMAASHTGRPARPPIPPPPPPYIGGVRS